MRGFFGPMLTGVMAAVGCSSASEAHDLVVNLRTDLVAVEEFATVEIVVFPVDGSGVSDTIALEAVEGGYLPARRLHAFEGLPSDGYRLEASLLAKDGTSLTNRPVLMEVKSSLAVTIPISRSCLNVQCPEDLACFAGECVDPRCTLESPEFCGDISQCGSDDDCSVEAACATGECVLGTCWGKPVDSRSQSACNASTEWCSPEVGCLERELPQLTPGTFAIDSPLTIEAAERDAITAGGSAIISMPSGRAVPGGVYIGISSDVALPRIFHAPFDGTVSEFAVSDSSPDENISDLAFPETDSPYPDGLYVASSSSGGGDGVFRVNAEGEFTELSASNNVVDLDFDTDADLMQGGGDESLIVLTGGSDAFFVSHMLPDGERVAFTASIFATELRSMSVPNTGPLKGSAYLASNDDNPQGTIYQATPTAEPMTLDISLWSAGNLGAIHELIALPEGSRFGEGLLVLDTDLSTGESRVLRILPSRSRETILDGLLDARDMALDETGNTLWILERGRGEVVRVRAG